jgi:hypothetical protein
LRIATLEAGFDIRVLVMFMKVRMIWFYGS